MQLAVIAIAVFTIAGMLARPFGTRDWYWAAGGGAVMLLGGFVHFTQLASIVLDWFDVAAFLTGMMMLAEIARRCDFFDWLADRAARAAGGSTFRLFALMYGIGICVTAFLSNDATAIVLTPAVAAVVRRSGTQAWPHVLGCALIANAASFLLPIANPANLVFFGATPPQILPWFAAFLLPSVAAIGVTFAIMCMLERKNLATTFELEEADENDGSDSPSGVPFTAAMGIIAGGIFATAVVLLIAMQMRVPLGITTLICGTIITLVCVARKVCTIMPILRHVSWGVIALTAGLFLIVAAFDQQHCTEYFARMLAHAATLPPFSANLAIAAGITALCALANNLPIGLLAHHALDAPAAAHLAQTIRTSTLIAVNLGPNLAVSGSLATILWMQALDREGIAVDAWRFFRVGCIVAPLSLIAAIACVR